MSITGALILFAVIWFMVLFIILQLRSHSQAEDGDIVEGTHASAPADFRPGRAARDTTIITVILWCIIASVILSGWITVRDLDWFNRMGPPPQSLDSPSGETDG